MSPMRIIILVGAAGAAIGAAFLMRNMSAQQMQSAAANVATVVQTEEVSEVQVLVAKRNMFVGDSLAEEDFAWAPWPENSLVDTYYTEAKTPEAIKELAGAIVKMPIYEHEPIHPGKLVTKSDTGVMAALVAPGMRAMSLEISEETASGGFILPNDRVDVILTHELKAAEGTTSGDRPVSTTIIRNVRVLAIDQSFRPDPEATEETAAQIGNTATLELNEDEVELVALALRMGQISLSLRPWSDTGESEPRSARLDLLENPGASGSGGGITVFRNGEPGGS